MSVSKDKKYVPQRRQVATPAKLDTGLKVHRYKAKTLTNSSRSTFLNCRKKWEFEYRHLIVNKGVYMPFLVGGLFHDGLEEMYTKGKFDHAAVNKVVSAACEDASDKCVDSKESDLVWAQRAVVMGMLTGYAQLYLKEDLKKYKVVSAESEFEIPLPLGWKYRGKRDLLVQDKKSKALVLVEHKTASSITPGYIAKLPLDNQILGYAWSVSKEKGRSLPDHVIYNVTKKPGIRQKATETFNQYVARLEAEYTTYPDKYFYREKVYFGKKEVNRFVVELEKFTAEMDRSLKENFFYQNTTYCTAYNGQCAYMPLCVNGPNKSNLMRYRVKDRAHEELESK